MRYDSGGHGVDHASSLHDSGEGSGCEKDSSHEDGCGGVRVDAFLLCFKAGEIERERDDGAEHERDGGIDAAADHGAENDEGDEDVKEEEAGALGLLRCGRIRCCLAGEVWVSQESAFFAAAEHPGCGENESKADSLHCDQGDEDC